MIVHVSASSKCVSPWIGDRRVRRHRREESVREHSAHAVERIRCAVTVVTGDEADNDLRPARHRNFAEAQPGPSRPGAERLMDRLPHLAGTASIPVSWKCVPQVPGWPAPACGDEPRQVRFHQRGRWSRFDTGVMSGLPQRGCCIFSRVAASSSPVTGRLAIFWNGL